MFSSKIVSQNHEIVDSRYSDRGVSLWMKREDLIHPEVSGNKWRKLAHNISEAKKGEYSQVVTFGGAFSNHIAATASACKMVGIPCVGIIRGEEFDPNNPTLQKALTDGMELRGIDRSEYRQLSSMEDLADYPNAFVIPEGGDNALGRLGCESILAEDNRFDLVVVACGTGGTLSGIVNSLQDGESALGIAVIKGKDELTAKVASQTNNDRFKISFDHHLGGYAKRSEELEDFIRDFKSKHGIMLDPIYTGKMMLAVDRLIEDGSLANKRVLVIHTGGLQGIPGYENRYGVVL